MKRVRALTRKMLRAELTGSDTCTLGQLGLSVHSRSPVIKLTRELIALGIDPRTKLEVFRGDILALKVRSIHEAAGLCVAEGDHSPRFAAALEPDAFRRAPANAINGPRGYLDQRFLGSNHIRPHRRACRTMCGRQDGG
jgi:hypothetical protein